MKWPSWLAPKKPLPVSVSAESLVGVSDDLRRFSRTEMNVAIDMALSVNQVYPDSPFSVVSDAAFAAVARYRSERNKAAARARPRKTAAVSSPVEKIEEPQ